MIKAARNEDYSIEVAKMLESYRNEFNGELLKIPLKAFAIILKYESKSMKTFIDIRCAAQKLQPGIKSNANCYASDKRRDRTFF